MFATLIQGTDMNLRLAKGKVPIDTGDGYVFIPFPDEEEFCQLYNNYTPMDRRKRYWKVLRERIQGKTLKDSGLPHGISKQRVREIEAKFIRLITTAYFCKPKV